MKKLISILAVSLCGFMPTHAQYWGPQAGRNLIPAMQKINHRIARALGLNNVEWVREVRYEERRLQPTGPTEASYYAFSTQNFSQQPVRKDYALFRERHALVSQALGQNHTLKNYKFVVPIPADLTQTPAQDIDYLLAFLAQPADADDFNAAYTPYSVIQAEKGVTEIKLKHQNILILRVDSFKHKVYFFLNEY